MLNTRLLSGILCVICFVIYCPIISSQSICGSIDFESIPNVDQPLEGVQIDSQYFDSLGVLFSLADGNIPVLAEVGDPVTAFQSQFGNDRPANDQGVGNYFLTDDGELFRSNPPSVILTFSNPVDTLSGIILDIDSDEEFNIIVFDQDSIKLDSVLLNSGSENAGDGLATPWAFKRDLNDISRIVFDGSRSTVGFGLAFDNIYFCQSDSVTSLRHEISQDYLQIFPNPSYGSISINSLNLDINRIELFDLIGRQVSFTADYSGNLMTISTDHKGVAILRASSVDHRILTRKVVFR